MVFSSVTFLFFFLPAILILNFLLPAKYRNYLIILASLLFYWWGEHRFVLVMLFSICANYFIGLGIRNSSSEHIRKRWLLLGICINLGLLCFFKYVDFIVTNLSSLWILGSGAPLTNPNIYLPIGISFFTFQAMSYIIDVYRQKETAMANPAGVALYISSFPQLIAGPIVRYAQIKRQLDRRFIPPEKVTFGIKRFVIGLGKKILIANTLAAVADQIFAMPGEGLSVATAWLGTVCCTLQIYFDFSGYSDMAIGLGHMLGFTFPENFNYPYIAKSIREFWQRWHISLSSWFRDYLYIPLGGNRLGTVKTFRNLLIVFLLCGLWHGASWNFVIWGLFHGLFLIMERARFFKIFLLKKNWLAHVYTLLVVMIGWVFFRTETLTSAWGFLGTMFGIMKTGPSSYPVQLYLSTETIVVLLVGIIGATPLLPWLRQKVLSVNFDRGPTYMFNLKWGSIQLQETLFMGIVVVLCAIKLSAGTYNPFIYFRF